MKTRTLKQTGIIVGGTATMYLWGGGEADIEMDEVFIPNNKISKDNILSAVNDGRFGCEGIKCAEIEIYDAYENNYREYNRIIYADKFFSKYFLKRGI